MVLDLEYCASVLPSVTRHDRCMCRASRRTGLCTTPIHYPRCRVLCRTALPGVSKTYMPPSRPTTTLTVLTRLSGSRVAVSNQGSAGVEAAAITGRCLQHGRFRVRLRCCRAQSVDDRLLIPRGFVRGTVMVSKMQALVVDGRRAGQHQCTP